MKPWLSNLSFAASLTLGVVLSDVCGMRASSAVLGLLLTAAITGLLTLASRRRR